MKQMKTIEGNVASAILQRAESIEIGGKVYNVTPPTPATLIMVSEAVAELPQMDSENIVAEVLGKARSAKALGRILAVLILGAKRINENRKVRTNLWRRKSEVDYIADYVLENLTIEELLKVVSQRLSQMQIGDFFGLTTSLSAANITKPTKEVVTQYGE